MDWSKIDAALAAALADVADRSVRALPVFVRVDPSVADPDLLAELGLEGGSEGEVRTGTVSAQGVRRLTRQPWVRRVQLSGPLDLLGPP